MKKIHKFSRWIWFFNGIFIMILVLILFYTLISELFEKPKSVFSRNYEKGPIVGNKLEKAKSDSLALQDIIVSLPINIGDSEYRYIRISSDDLEEPLSYRKTEYCMNMEPPSYGIYDDLVNVLFFKKGDYSNARLLLSEKANIVMMDVPESEDTLRDFILYGVATEDTNEDGRLNASDRTDLFLSGLAGDDFHKITDEKVYLVDYSIDLADYEILLKVQEKPSDQRAADQPRIERLLVYDLLEKKLYQPLEIQKFVSEARRLLWR